MNFKDCYYSFENNILIIGNESIERRMEFKDKVPVTTHLINKTTKYDWINNEIDFALFNNTIIDFKKYGTTVQAYIGTNEGLSEEHMVVELKFDSKMASIMLKFTIFSQSPFITSRLFIKAKSVVNSLSNENHNNKQDYNGIENLYILNDKKDLHKSTHLPELDCIDSFSINAGHLKLESIELVDRTDINDYLVKDNIQSLYIKRESRHAGNMFILDSYLNSEGLMLVKEGPSIFASLNRDRDELYIKPETGIQFIGSGIDYSEINSSEYIPAYGCTVGVGRTEQLKELYKRLYKKVYLGDKSRELFIMSNTWGDRNQDVAVCHDFIMKEIDVAKELGVDILQIDDGWQKGITANSKLAKGGVWEGYYSVDPDFWDVNSAKFPKGLEPIVNHATQYDIKIGLWFSPDSSKDFKNWKLDAEVLMNLYRKFNIRYFKLDGIKIRNKQCEINFSAFLNKVSKESNNNVSFNLDVTAEIRYGYMYEKQYGTIFVENRYTDWGSYYPHNTLKNLWQLSKVMPSRKFQFEVLNNKRNLDKYGKDVLAPSNYTIDYEFAAVMVSNPLIWMEMCNLCEEDKNTLAKIISVYKKERKNIFNSEVIPIGSIPDGRGFTGFQVRVNSSEGYLLLFREYSTKCDFKFQLSELADKILGLEFLYGNYDMQNYIIEETLSEEGILSVNFSKQRSFAFVKYTVLTD